MFTLSAITRLFIAISLALSSSAQDVFAMSGNTSAAPTASYTPIVGANFGPWQAGQAEPDTPAQPQETSKTSINQPDDIFKVDVPLACSAISVSAIQSARSYAATAEVEVTSVCS